MTADDRQLQFPPDFLFGAATASYQIEGAVDEDGRGTSIWDRFCAIPGNVRNGDTGEVACDHYHRFAADVALMRDLGVNAYRFSTAWPRILPLGRGQINHKGLDFYDRLVDELLTNDIQPFITLYHWDLPQPLEDLGGWTNRDTVDAFAAYVEILVRHLGDRVKHWITQNEPWVTAWLGYGWGVHAPGRKGEANALAAAHYLLLSHGRAVEIIRQHAPDAAAGITLNLTPIYPATDSPEDAAAARAVDGMHNRWYLDPIFRGRYPDDVSSSFAGFLPDVQEGDMAIIRAPIDFLGVNNYSRSLVRADPATGKPQHVRPDGARFTDMDWEVYPQGLYDLLMRIHQDYEPPVLYVTENGSSFPDVRLHDGCVRDPERREYFEAHLASCSRAIADRVPLRGYFAWSLLDNFEWVYGYGMRFGLVYVDYPTLERTPKSSATWYRDFIATHRPSVEARTR